MNNPYSAREAVISLDFSAEVRQLEVLKEFALSVAAQDSAVRTTTAHALTALARLIAKKAEKQADIVAGYIIPGPLSPEALRAAAIRESDRESV